MRSGTALVFVCVFSLACTSSPGDDVSEPQVQQALDTSVVAVRIAQRSPSARVLELVGGDGRVVATYYPGFFNATELIPDVDSGQVVSRWLAGTWFLGAALDGATGRVAVAIRGFVYAETSFDLVFLIDTRSPSFGQDPYSSASATFLPFDGRKNDGTMPGGATGVRPWLDVFPEGVSFDEDGLLRIGVADASGAMGEFTFAPDLRVQSCTWTYGGASARCPDPSRI